MQNKNTKVDFNKTYVTEWRNSLKEQMVELSLSDIYDEKTKKYLNMLKSNLNIYGKCASGKYPKDIDLDIMKDQHIWKEIDKIERGEGDFKSAIHRINTYILCLLRINWEKQKKEIGLDFSFLLLSCAYWGTVILILCFGNMWDKNIEGMIWEIELYLCAYCLMLLPVLYDKIDIVRNEKWYRSAIGLFVSMISGYIIWWIVTLVILVIYIPHGPGKALAAILLLLMNMLFLVTEIKALTHKEMYRDYERSVLREMDSSKVTLFYRNEKKRRTLTKKLSEKNIELECNNIKKNKKKYNEALEIEKKMLPDNNSNTNLKSELIIEYKGRIYFDEKVFMQSELDL